MQFIFYMYISIYAKFENLFLITNKKERNLIEKCIICSLLNIKAVQTVILKILKACMAKGTKLSEFEKGEISALKRVGISQRGRNITVICNYLKSPNKFGTRKPTGRPEKFITTIQEKNCSRSKKENFVNIKHIEISSGCSFQY